MIFRKSLKAKWVTDIPIDVKGLKPQIFKSLIHNIITLELSTKIYYYIKISNLGHYFSLRGYNYIKLKKLGYNFV